MSKSLIRLRTPLHQIGSFNKDVEVIQVVRTHLTMRGEGVVGNPIRRIEQFWSLDGELLAENDSWVPDDQEWNEESR